jgi:hypothetical protein
MRVQNASGRRRRHAFVASLVVATSLLGVGTQVLAAGVGPAAVAVTKYGRDGHPYLWDPPHC